MENNGQVIFFKYKNYKGEVSTRRVLPDRIEFGVNPHQLEPVWLLWGIDLDKGEVRAFVLNNILEFFSEEKLDRHFCVTVYVFNKEKNKVLLLMHKKLKKWLPPGGHVDVNELPEDAALRETFEETGLRVVLNGERPEFEGAMVRPEGAQLNPIVKGQHEHMDLIFSATGDADAVLEVAAHESQQLKWIGVDEFLSGGYETFPSVLYWVRRFACQE